MRFRGTGLAVGITCVALLVPAGASARKYTVNKTADPGPAKCQFQKKKLKKNKCSLRAAIEAANAHPGADKIVFRIGKGQKTITTQSSLPDLTDKVTIDGWTQKGFTSKPLIEINGADVAPEFGLSIVPGAEDSVVRGLIINGNSGYGIRLFQVSGIDIAGCWIGLQEDGVTPAPVGFSGILLDSAPDTTIGGASAKERNVISGNSGDGITATSSSSSTPVTIVGNRIGTNDAGTAAVGNGGTGIDLANAPGAITIGTPGAGNVISGNGVDGVRLQDVDEFSGTVTMQGNLIGVSADGETDLGNGDDGIQHLSPRSNHIGGSSAAARNVISGNGGAGIHLEGAFNQSFGVPDNWIRGNYIGTNGAGLKGLGNTSQGVWLDNATAATFVGGTGAGEGNVIAGSESIGRGIKVSGTDGVTIVGNKIGVNKNDAIVGDHLDNAVGIDLAGGSFRFIGANAGGAAGPNVIGNNEIYGIRMDGGSGAYIANNFVGSTQQGAVIPNGTDPTSDAGIFVFNSAEAVIGETQNGAPAPNLIVNNHGDGVKVGNAFAEITRNLIALNDGLGIDLLGGTEDGFGVNPNDDDDADTGSNFLMNHPVVTSVVPSGTGANYTVSMDAKPNTTYRIDLFADTPGDCDPSGYGEGGAYLTTLSVTTNHAGVGSNVIFRNGGIGSGIIVSGTASYDEFIGTGLDVTSEFGPCYTVP
jgi:hypothetical protein